MNTTEHTGESGLFQKIRSLIVARLLIGSTLLLGTALPLEINGLFSVSRFIFPLVTIILILTIIYSGLLNVLKNLRILVYLQLVGDIFLETLIIMATGGIESPFSILYVITIIVASYLIPQKGSFLTAFLIIIAFGSVVLCQYLGWTEWWPISTTWVLLPPPSFAAYIIFINLVGYLLTAILANNLSERLRKINQMLQSKNVQYSYLWTLNRRIVNEISSGLITTTKSGKILSINPAAKNLLDLPDEFENQFRLEDALPNYLVQSILRVVDSEALKKREIQYQFVNHEETRWLQIEVISLKEKSKDPARLMLIIKDFTDQKKFEEIKRKTQRWSTVAEVSAGMAHEIRNPLASISGSIEVLRDQLSLTDSQNRLMSIVIRESDRLNKLISEFLDLARPRMPEFEPVDINALLSEVLLLIKSDDSFKDNIQCQLQVEPADLSVDIDRDQITQMTWNLMKNAFDAMPGGGTLKLVGEVTDCLDPMHVALDNSMDLPFFRLTISDSGIGIEKDVLDRIFDPFTTFKRRGVGIGLAIVYRIVENHNGRISIQSKPRKGTMFCIDLPLKQTEPEDVDRGRD